MVKSVWNKKNKGAVIMIGLGKWTGDIETGKISATAIVDIWDNNGEYAFNISVPSVDKIPDFTVFDVKEEGNRLSGKAKIAVMGTLTVEIFAEFFGDTFEAHIKIPFLGNIPIKNGRRITE